MEIINIKHFGIPWLGLKRGLADERVVSSYGSILALTESPKDVIDNLKALEKENMLGEYGVYESIDYTSSRLKVNSKSKIVKTYMAHHQGLILASINNFLNNNSLVERFENNPEIEAVSILQQERMPQMAIITKEKKEKIQKTSPNDYETYSQREFTKKDEFFNRTNIIGSNGYVICMDEDGKGYSKYNNILINKFKEGSEEEQGIFFFVKNVKNNKIWSSARLKKTYLPDKYKVIFSPDNDEIIRTDGNIETKMKTAIAPANSAEIREIILKNIGQTEETLEITSFLEPALCTKEQFFAHPAFNDLFLSFEWDNNLKSIIVRKKAKTKAEEDIYMGVSLYTPQEETNDIQYEINKSEFIGRCNIGLPEKIEKSKPFSNTVEPTTENCIAMKSIIRIKPNEEVKIALVICINSKKEYIKNTLQEYRNFEKVDRIYKLARAKCEAENRYLGITDKDTELYQKMLTYLLFQNPLNSLNLKKIPKDIYPIQGLWSLGISGDLPILLVKIQNPNDSYVIDEILKAKEFYMLKNCDVDIVILNEEQNVYEQYVKERIESLILEKHLAHLQGQKNGVFVINGNEIEKKQKNLLLFRANLFLDAEKGKLFKQIEELEESYIEEQPKNIGFERNKFKTKTNKSQISIDQDSLIYNNGYGGFNEDGNEYITKIQEDENLPVVWSHILANERFGTIITENLGGFTWNKNSRLNRLSSWNNIPYLDIPSEILYIKDVETGNIWSNSRFISKKEGDFKSVYGFGYGEYTNLCNDCYCKTTVFVPQEDPIKISVIKIKNMKSNSRKLKLIFYIKPVLGEDESLTMGFLDLKKESTNCLSMQNLENETFTEIAFAGTSEKITSYTGDKNMFLGNGGILNPDGVNKISLDNSNSLGKVPCIALEFEIELGGYESKEFSIFFGEAEDKSKMNNLVEKYSNIQNCYSELDKIKKYWYEILNRLKVKTPEKSMNIMLNGWLLYQTICCRLFARTGYYQSGGAYGFRDQLQDVCGLKYIDKSFLEEQIIKACKHQFEEGDVEHWWHDETNRGIRTRFSDDLLWLPYAVYEYLNLVDNNNLLDTSVEYLEGKVLSDGEDERYDIYLPGQKEGSIYEHCIKAIDKSINLGNNGLPKIGSGDWNDGFNTVGNKGIGESVWLGFFLYDILNKFIPICNQKGDLEKAKYYETIKGELKKALNTNGWDGRWFKRAFTDSKENLGTNQNEECKIDSISQSWSVLSSAGDNDKKYIAMESLENFLIDKENSIIKLLTPPFQNSNLEPGYIKSYIPGVRENGGQYTHAAAWIICAFAQLGLGEKSLEYFKMINPIEHSKTKEEANKYKVEPYVASGDVYSTYSMAGRGGWTWYTGSSSWLYRAGIEWILGLRINNKELTMMPNISPKWKEYSIRYRYKESVYNIRVLNPYGKTSGINIFKLNGKEIKEKKIKLDENGGNYDIEIEM